MIRLPTLVTCDDLPGVDIDIDMGLAPQQTRIGRLDIELIRRDQPFARNWERVHSVHDASYVLVFPLIGSVAFSQDGRTNDACTDKPQKHEMMGEPH